MKKMRFEIGTDSFYGVYWKSPAKTDTGLKVSFSVSLSTFL